MSVLLRDANRNIASMAKDYGQEFVSVGDIWEYIEEQQRKRNKCKKCGYQCRGFDHLERHENNLDCVRRQNLNAAEFANEVYIPNHKKKKWCELCRVAYHRYFKHEDTIKHKDAVDAFLGEKFELKCLLCEKEFGNKCKLTRHLKNSKKCHRKVVNGDKYLKWDCMCKKLHVRWDPKLVVIII